MASAKNKIFAFILAALAICSGAVCYLNKGEIEFPLLDAVELDSPYIVRDQGSNRYILDKQRARIVVVDKASNVVQNILPSGAKEADVFYYADDFMVDRDGSVYVKEGAWDGNRISREAVLLYGADGRYKATYLDRHYDQMVNKHKMMLLGVSDGTIHYAVKNEGNVAVASYDIKNRTKSQRRVLFENAFDFVADMARSSDGTVYLLEKTGRLFRLAKDSPRFDLVRAAGKDEFPNWIEPGDGSKLLCADLYSDGVVELDLSDGTKRVVL